jgi:hypothetical protein
MKHLLKLLAFVLSFFKKTPSQITLRHQFNALQAHAAAVDDITFWFHQNPHYCTNEIVTQLENSSSRLAALTSAVLIKIRFDEEQVQIQRIMKGITK